MFDLRKVKKVGGSHVIALPGWWLKSEALGLGGPIEEVELTYINRTIVISSHPKVKTEP